MRISVPQRGIIVGIAHVHKFGFGRVDEQYMRLLAGMHSYCSKFAFLLFKIFWSGFDNYCRDVHIGGMGTPACESCMCLFYLRVISFY